MTSDADKQAREELAKERQHTKHLQDTMSSRANAEMSQSDSSHTEEQAREGITHDRQHGEHLRETMADRADAEA